MKKLIVFISVTTFLFSSCKKQKTSWNSDWAAPIVHDTLSLDNFYNDSTLFSTDGFTLNINLTRNILNIGIKDLISINDTLISQTTTPTINLSNIPPGSNFINQTQEHNFDLNGIQLKKIIIGSGEIKVKVYNPISTRAYFTVQLPGATKNGTVFEKTYIVDGGSISQPGTAEETLDLSGYTVDLTGINHLSFNKLQSKLNIKSDPDGPAVSISTSNVFRFDAQISGISPDYAKGYFGNTLVSDTTEFNILALQKITEGNIDLPSPNLTFEIENGVKVALQGGLLLAQNTNSQGNTVTLTSSNIGNNFIVSEAIGSWSSLTPNSQSLTFNAGNSNIEQFIENVGSINKIGYRFQLNPWGNTSGGNDEIFPNSRIKVKIHAEMPMSIGLDGLTLRDTFDINIPNDETKTHVNSGIFTLTATNAFPLSCQPIIYLMDENNNILHTIIAESQISSSNMGTTDPANGLKKKKSKVDFILNETVAADLIKVKKVIVEAIFNTPNVTTGISEQQNIPNGAFLSIDLKLKLNTKIIL